MAGRPSTLRKRARNSVTYPPGAFSPSLYVAVIPLSDEASYWETHSRAFRKSASSGQT